MSTHDALDISNKPSPHTLRNKLGRVLWGLVSATLFRWSPKPMRRWRAFLLRCFGGNVSLKARVDPTAIIWAPWNLTLGDYTTLGEHSEVYCVYPIVIGAQTTVSQYAYLCGATHDFEHPKFPIIPGEIVIGANCWIATDVFVGPNVTIGDGTVVGARSSVFHDLPAGKICAGAPAKPLRDRVIRAPGAASPPPAPAPAREPAT